MREKKKVRNAKEDKKRIKPSNSSKQMLKQTRKKGAKRQFPPVSNSDSNLSELGTSRKRIRKEGNRKHKKQE
jgi:hypothetical protein